MTPPTPPASGAAESPDACEPAPTDMPFPRHPHATSADPALGRRFAADSRGVTSIEYSLLASLIAVTIAGICSMLFSQLSAEYVGIANIFS